MEKSLVFIVLNKVEVFEKLFVEMNDAGFRGTAINSSGMAQELAKHEDSYIISSFRAFMTAGKTENKTIFTVVPTEKIDTLHKVVTNVVGDLSKPNTAIIISTPVNFCYGIDQLK